MIKIDIVRAWKDGEYRASLSEAERASLPENPAGAIELTEVELEGVAGGYEEAITLNSSTCKFGSLGCSCTPTSD
ncbi:MAG TPA: mersacidin/lichenicidin family type 2 lantibiotic [Polyangiaceae bacterium]|nr:mersacidin/lichenicidin family type 2 lantibiotic [Polyangiaceae bacterium]